MHALREAERDGPVAVTVGYVGGGSRGWAPTLMGDLARTTDLAGEVVLYDVDRESAERNARLGERYQAHPETVGDWTYRVADDLEGALSGADFVLLSTQDPPAETMAHDLEIPASYGVHQTVGDTVGPGGTLRAMRAVPQYREIAAAIREHCPDAWVLNFTNPMSACTRTLYEEFPEIDALGICHEVYHAQAHLAEFAREHLGIEADSNEVDLDVTGINHFTWVTRASHRGRDLLPAVESELAERDLPSFEPGDMADAGFYDGNNEVALDLYRRFGVFPAAGDRHLAEFVPWYLDVDDPEEIHRWGIRVTPSEHRVEHWPEGESHREAVVSGEREPDLSRSGEEMVDLMRALVGLEPLKTNVNLPNRGQAPDLPGGAVVETNALVTGDAVTPLTADPLPREVRSLVERHVANQETLVEAGFAGDVDRAYRAFCDDPLVATEAGSAAEMFRELVEIQRPYLQAYDLEGSWVLGDG